MVQRGQVARILACCAGVLLVASAFATAQTSSGSSAGKAMVINFRGTDYVHRWSRSGQNEFTPGADSDLARWRDMVTLNVHETVGNGDQLAELANRVLTNYQSRGKVVRTDSKPRTQQQSAEHVIVAVLGNPAFLEAAFARFLLVDGKGVVVVYSHRIYGQDAGPAMSAWLQANGATTEKALMSWGGLPSVAALRALPQAK
jgi:hypothetical protein